MRYRVLIRGLLVIVGAEALYPTEIARLRRRAHVVGRLFVDVAVDPPVDQPEILHATEQRQLPTMGRPSIDRIRIEL